MKKGEKYDNTNKPKKRKTSYSDDSDDDYVLENDDDVESNSSGGFIDHNNPSEEEGEEFDDFEKMEGDANSSDSDDDELISSRKRKRKQKVAVRSKDSKSDGKRTRVKPQRRKKTLSSNDDYSDGDEDYCVFDDEFAIEKVATGSKSSGKKTRGRTRQSCKDTRVSDEEYCEFEDEIGGKKTKGRKQSTSKRSKASDEEYCEFEDELGGNKNRGRRQSSNRGTRVSDQDEEYCEFEDELGGGKTKGRQQSTSKRSKASASDEDYCEFEDELGGNKNRGRRQSSNRDTRVSDQDEEYCEFEDELGGEKTKGRHQSTSKRSEASASDEEYCEFEDELGGNKNRGRRLSSNRDTKVSDEDEEYCEFDDELGEKKTKGRRQSTSKRSKASDDDEEYCEFEDESGGKKPMGRRQSTSKRSKASDNVEEYCEFEDELGEKKTKGRRQSTSKRSKASDDDDEYCEFEDEKDEDEEFEPDGIDFVDEVEEEMEGKKAVKRRKISVERRNIKRKTKVAKKRERGILGVRKPAESSDEDFVDTVSVVREKCKKTTRSRSKRVVTDWDSDSACSKSSDLEYTISEEEKESLEEAKKFCGELKTCTRRSVPMKERQVDEEGPNLQEEKPLRRLRKGKATVNDLSNDSGKQVCGICLSEEGNAIVKGALDCCSHYFCFGCIMEWSKVESRCPLCKQRFSSITRAPRSSLGIDLRTTVVQVPMRDQVYRPSEEEVRGYFDPYENVLCMECHQGGDDSLMLLCDICDSPAHTYCVGLQREVPEGNWYCEGCRISEASSSNIQLQIPVVNRGVSGNDSISTSLPAYRTNTEDLFSPPQHLPIQQPSYSQGFWNLQSSRYSVHAPSPSGAGVSTLLGRRRVHRQVHDRVTVNRGNQTTDYLGRTSVIPEIDLNREVVEAELYEDRIDQRSRDVLLISESISTEFDHWVQEGGSHSARLSPSRQVAGLGTSITITSGPELTTSRSEHGMTNLLLGSEHFHHCSSVRSDDSISPRTKSYTHKDSAS